MIRQFIRRLIWRYWYRYIYLRSLAWHKTRRDNISAVCNACGEVRGLQLHHVVYRLNYRPEWKHFLPDGRLRMRKADTRSTFETLCDDCHRRAHE